MEEQIIEEVLEEVIVEPKKTDFCLKLPSEADMPTALADFYKQDYVTVVDEETGESTQTPEGEPYFVAYGAGYAVDVIGNIHEPTGVILTNEEGMEYPETAALDGWHLNIRLSGNSHREAVEALDAAYGVTPNSPSRVWL